MRFFYTIHKKPRGNYRPLIEFGFELNPEDTAHNPYIPPIFLTYDYFNKNRGDLIESHNPNAVVIDLTQLKSDGENWCLWRENKRGDKHSHCDEFRDFPHKKLTFGGYQSHPLSNDYSFYAPWKSGASPDYSEIIPVLFSIREILEVSLKDGLDSGESEERVGDMSLDIRDKRESWQGVGTTVEKPAPKTVATDDGRQVAVRHLDID